MNKKITVFITLLICAVACVFYFFPQTNILINESFQNEKKPKKALCSAGAVSSEVRVVTAKDPVNWKTFYNDVYGYRFPYQDFLCLYADDQNGVKASLPDGFGMISINVIPIDGTVDDWMKNSPYINSNLEWVVEQKLKVAEYDAVMAHLQAPTELPVKVDASSERFVLFKKDNNLFEVWMRGFPQQEYILQNFKFD